MNAVLHKMRNPKQICASLKTHMSSSRKYKLMKIQNIKCNQEMKKCLKCSHWA
jgi:hypothetical protein